MLAAHNDKKGAVLWLTGLPASGKSTLALEIFNILKSKGMPVEHLDGDKIREIFPNTGFDRISREEHIRRVGFLASKLESHGIIVVVSLISPYQSSRNSVRQMCQEFYEIYVSTPLEICKKRDPKGFYKLALEGKIKNFTGIQDPYESPLKPELVLDTSILSISQCSERILKLLNS